MPVEFLGLRCCLVALFGWLCGVGYYSDKSIASDSPEAIALLMGAASVRTHDESYTASFTTERINPDSSQTLKCLVDWDKSKRRCEVIETGSSSGVVGRVFMSDGRDVFDFSRRKHADVRVFGTGRIGIAGPDFAL